MSNATDAAGAPPAGKLRLTPVERRASISLALLFAVRMLGLFLLTPVFAVAAQALRNGDNATRVGIALGAYGLTQALMQIPLGMASDRWGRRPVIVFGLLLFIVGGVVCAVSDDVTGIIIGRTLQGLGAVSAAITAWVADATRPEVRTRAMAMIGGSIGLSFAASLVLAPLLVGVVGLSGLFWVISALGLACLLIALFVVPAAPRAAGPAIAATSGDVLRDSALVRLNLGVFCLHFIIMALFITVPALLMRLGGYAQAQLWKVYLPVILVSFVLMLPAVFYTETRHVHARTLRVAVAGLAIALALMPLAVGSLTGMIVLLIGFFIAFNILEALQPSLVSRTAPPALKGMALGVFNTAQSLGVFAGGVVGGLMASHASPESGFLLCAAVALVWLALSGRGKAGGQAV